MFAEADRMRPDDDAAARDGCRTSRRRQRAWRTLAPVWATQDVDALSPADVERLRPHDLHTDRNSDAEYAFYGLAGRFQLYADEYLFADERVLAFAPWTAETSETWRRRLGRWIAPGGREPLEGALLVTNRQVFLLRDDAEVVGGGLAWGYRAKATTPERLASVDVTVNHRGRVQLTLDLRANCGQETIDLSFPPGAKDAIQRIADLLAEFLPRAGDRRLRLPGRISPRERLALPPAGRCRATDAVLVADAERTALAAALERWLADHPDPVGVRRRTHAMAVDPGEAERGPELAALTQSDIIRIRLPVFGPPKTCPLAHVTSAELRRSVLGWHVGWTAPADGPAPAETSRMPFPVVAGNECLAFFAALRQALTLLPVEADGPEIAVDDSGEEESG